MTTNPVDATSKQPVIFCCFRRFIGLLGSEEGTRLSGGRYSVVGASEAADELGGSGHSPGRQQRTALARSCSEVGAGYESRYEGLGRESATGTTSPK